EARTRAYADYLRAATIAPARTPPARETPPQAMADFARAAAEIRQRPRGSLSVSGSADALVALDGGPAMPVAGGLVLRDLVAGEHLIRVEEVGHAGWGAVVAFNPPAQEVTIPPRPVLGLDGATAAAHARRMGARFALVLEPKGGPHAPGGLRLIDANGQGTDARLVPGWRLMEPSGRARAAVLVTAGAEAGMIDSAVMRLDETARKLAQAEAQSGAQ